MTQSALPAGQLMVAVQGVYALVKIAGRGTFKLAPSLKRFCAAAQKRGCREIVFDMEDCMGMDSTFMGVLAGVAMWPLPGIGRGHVAVLNLTPKTHAMLVALGLDRLLACYERDEVPPDFKARLADALHLEGLDWNDADDKRLSLDTMLQAHQHLVQAEPENLARFRDVLTYLDQELRQMDAGEGRKSS